MVGPDSDPTDAVKQLQVQFTEEIEPEDSIVESDGGLVEWVHDEFGDDLRVVGAYDENTYEYLYIKSSVRDQYTMQEFAASGDEFVLSSRQEDPYQERLYRLGSFKYEVRGFEDGQIIRIPLKIRKGLIISFESTANVLFPEFVNQIKEQHEFVFK